MVTADTQRWGQYGDSRHTEVGSVWRQQTHRGGVSMVTGNTQRWGQYGDRKHTEVGSVW